MVTNCYHCILIQIKFRCIVIYIQRSEKITLVKNINNFYNIIQEKSFFFSLMNLEDLNFLLYYDVEDNYLVDKNECVEE